MTLKDAIEGKEYVIKQIDTDDEKLNVFPFSLGCYSGEAITVVAKRKVGMLIYNTNKELKAEYALKK